MREVEEKLNQISRTQAGSAFSTATLLSGFCMHCHKTKALSTAEQGHTYTQAKPRNLDIYELYMVRSAYIYDQQRLINTRNDFRKGKGRGYCSPLLRFDDLTYFDDLRQTQTHTICLTCRLAHILLL